MAKQIINFQCKKIAENVKKSTAQGITLNSQLDFIDNDANKDLTFRLSVVGHPNKVKAFQNDISILDVDELFESTMKMIPKVRQTKLIEEKQVSKEVDDADKIDLDADDIAESGHDDNEDLID